MSDVERDEVGQGAHIGMRQAGKVLCDLDLEFKEQRCELVVEVREDVSRVCVDDGGTQHGHRIQSLLRKRERVVVARESVKVVLIEKATVHADAGTVERTALQERCVIAWQRMPHHRTEWRLQYTKQDGHVGDCSANWAGRILAVTNRNDPGLRNESKSGLKADNEVSVGGTDDRAVGLGANGCSTEVRRSGHG